MKRILSYTLIACMMIMSLCTAGYAEDIISPLMTVETGSVGDTVSVTVGIPQDTNAAGGSFNLVYDNAKMELVDATAGEILGGFSKTVNKTYAENKVRLNFAGSEIISANGGTLLTATFKLLSAGACEIYTEKFKLADIDANYITCDNTSLTINIEGAEEEIVFAPIISVPENGKIGDTISVSVAIPQDTNAAGGSFNLVYDISRVELIDATAGEILGGFSKTVNKTYAENKVRLNFAGSEIISANGGTLLTATFKLLSEGVAEFSTEKFKLADIDANYLACENTVAYIDIEKTDDVTEGICGDSLEWKIEDKILIITGSGEMYDYSSEGDYTLNPPPWFPYRDSIEGIVLPEGLTRIGDFGLVGCTGLNTITLPSTLVSIGERAFMDWIALEEIELPRSVTTIEDGAFEWNDSFKKITIYEGANEFGEGVFEMCNNLTIYGIAQSAANLYADENGIPFVALDIGGGDADDKVFAPIITAGMVDDIITVAVAIGQDTNAAGGSFNLVYDNAKVELIDATAGEILGGFSKTVNKTYAENKVRLNFAGSEIISANGGTLLTATFKPLSEGVAEFSTEKFKLADIDANYLTCKDSICHIDIEGIVPDIIPVTGIIFDKTFVSAWVGEEIIINARVLPENATNKEYYIKSLNEDIVTVVDGVLTAIAPGEATLVAESADGAYTAYCTVAVEEKAAPEITVSQIKTMPGSDIEVTIDLKGNKGFANLGIELGYDSSVLTLIKVNADSAVGATFTPAQTYIANPFNMSWDSASNVYYNGNLVTLTFAVSEDAPDGTYPLTLDYYKGVGGNYADGDNVNYDEDFRPVGFKYISGCVTVSDYIPGDINGDEIVDNKDATYLLRYLAGWTIPGVVEEALDVDGSGMVDNKDATTLLRYLAGWDVILH